ncbi:acyl-CoA thioester hydrolase/BAAT C-terminal domain-containing protein [Roseivirga sp. E12]|uniref:acyl-CoA thioester hydrolase/BAAT C-terminal domain-containing protein n=1 Tax=Roseivirga sp. E12 TaxID=2819237 RepID=UPI001ABC9B84|nr:acyl-CoA thioester hydrolase/BAAT C-terminal domain-containing protein [Roseivirga sp. E12]MBO3697537.1 acetylxylan esterase [Roseivirga sp. E12]
MWKKALLVLFVLILGLFIFLESYTPPLSDNYGKVQTRLYLGESENQPLIVGFGGSEGGNAWDSDFWKPTRDQFLAKGYAFLALGYFGAPDIPENLDRISLDAIHEAITTIAQNPKIDAEKIAIMGGSKGGELVLNLASYFDDIDAVIALSASHVSFAGLTAMSNTSSWMLKDEEIPFVPTPYSAVPSIISGDHLKVYDLILSNKDAEIEAQIPVERINGSVLLMSGSRDEAWPSTAMSNKVIERLKRNNFPHPYDHIVIEGGHTSPTEHFDMIFDFLEKTFPINTN